MEYLQLVFSSFGKYLFHALATDCKPQLLTIVLATIPGVHDHFRQRHIGYVCAATNLTPMVNKSVVCHSFPSFPSDLDSSLSLEAIHHVGRKRHTGYENRPVLISNTSPLFCDHPHSAKDIKPGLFLETVTLKLAPLGGTVSIVCHSAVRG